MAPRCLAGGAGVRGRVWLWRGSSLGRVCTGCGRGLASEAAGIALSRKLLPDAAWHVPDSPAARSTARFGRTRHTRARCRRPGSVPAPTRIPGPRRFRRSLPAWRSGCACLTSMLPASVCSMLPVGHGRAARRRRQRHSHLHSPAHLRPAAAAVPPGHVRGVTAAQLPLVQLLSFLSALQPSWRHEQALPCSCAAGLGPCGVPLPAMACHADPGVT
jgi:hypothetical protein